MLIIIRQVHVHYGANKGVCGGTIIDDETILTAAQCFYGPSDLGPQSEFIEAGIVIDQAPLGQDIFVKEIIRHPDFNNQTYDNNISILKLATPLQFNSHVKPACLPDEGQTAKKGFVSGWGSIRRFTIPDIGNLLTLSFFSAELIPDEECIGEFQKYGLKTTGPITMAEPRRSEQELDTWLLRCQFPKN